MSFYLDSWMKDCAVIHRKYRLNYLIFILLFLIIINIKKKKKSRLVSTILRYFYYCQFMKNRSYRSILSLLLPLFLASMVIIMCQSSVQAKWFQVPASLPLQPKENPECFDDTDFKRLQQIMLPCKLNPTMFLLLISKRGGKHFQSDKLVLTKSGICVAKGNVL